MWLRAAQAGVTAIERTRWAIRRCQQTLGEIDSVVTAPQERALGRRCQQTLLGLLLQILEDKRACGSNGGLWVQWGDFQHYDFKLQHGRQDWRGQGEFLSEDNFQMFVLPLTHTMCSSIFWFKRICFVQFKPHMRRCGHLAILLTTSPSGDAKPCLNPEA